jgi:hypothetical protein
MKILLILLSTVLLLSCGKKEITEAPGLSGDKKDSVQVLPGKDLTKSADNNGKDSAIVKNILLKWEFKTLGTGKYDEPVTQVYLIANGKKHVVQKIEFGFSEITKESYSDHHIPAEALTACRGWWAGAGIDYWVTRDNNELNVFSREIGETSTEDGEPSDYEGKPVKFKTILIEQEK